MEKEIDQEQVASKRRFLQSKQGRAVAVLCISVLLIAVILATRCAGDDVPEGWPTGALMEGIQPPEQGRIASVYQTDTTVAVYFEAFPADALAQYLQTLGIPGGGGSPYVLQMEGRFLVVTYDAGTEHLSLTVTPSA